MSMPMQVSTYMRIIFKLDSAAFLQPLDRHAL